MADLRESYAGGELRGLGWGVGEGNVDRVAAAGFCDGLGVMLWKVKYGFESGSYVGLVAGIVRVYRKRYRDNEDESRRVVDQGLREFLSAACGVCLGARQFMLGERKVDCDACLGSGVHRHTDLERASAMRVSLAKARYLGGRLSWIQGFLGGIDRDVNREMVRQLER